MYVQGLDEQNELFQSGDYVTRGAHLLAQLPNLVAVVLSGGSGGERLSANAAGVEEPRSVAFLRKRFPLTDVTPALHVRHDLLETLPIHVFGLLSSITDVHLREFCSRRVSSSRLHSSTLAGLLR